MEESAAAALAVCFLSPVSDPSHLVFSEMTSGEEHVFDTRAPSLPCGYGPSHLPFLQEAQHSLRCCSGSASGDRHTSDPENIQSCAAIATTHSQNFLILPDRNSVLLSSIAPQCLSAAFCLYEFACSDYLI